MKQIHIERTRSRSSEHGGARIKFLVVAVVLGLVAYSGYVFLPVAYDAYLYKDQMQQKVDMASVTGKPMSWVTEQLTNSAKDYNVPADAIITPSVSDSHQVIVRVQFTRPLQFPGYTYNYEFDHTAKSTAFLTIK